MKREKTHTYFQQSGQLIRKNGEDKHTAIDDDDYDINAYKPHEYTRPNVIFNYLIGISPFFFISIEWNSLLLSF